MDTLKEIIITLRNIGIGIAGITFIILLIKMSIEPDEKGKYLISIPFLYTICKKYNISADYLLGKIDNPKYLP